MFRLVQWNIGTPRSEDYKSAFDPGTRLKSRGLSEDRPCSSTGRIRVDSHIPWLVTPYAIEDGSAIWPVIFAKASFLVCSALRSAAKACQKECGLIMYRASGNSRRDKFQKSR